MSKPRNIFLSTVNLIKAKLSKEEVSLPQIQRNIRFEETTERLSNNASDLGGLDALKRLVTEKDQQDPKYRFYVLLEKAINNSTLTKDFSAKEKVAVFNYVVNEFISKLGKTQVAALLEQSDDYLAEQLRRKISNYDSDQQMKDTVDQKFLIDVRPQIPAIIEKLGFTPLYISFENALAGTLVQIIQSNYNHQLARGNLKVNNPVGIQNFLEQEVNRFFKEPVNGVIPTHPLIKKDIETLARNALEEALDDLEGGKYAALREKIEPEFLKQVEKIEALAINNIDPANYSDDKTNQYRYRRDIIRMLDNYANRFLTEM